MLGTRDDMKVGTKGADTFGLLLFIVDELKVHRDRGVADGAALIGAGESLVGLKTIWRKAGWRLTSAEIQTSYDNFNRFIGLTDSIPEFREKCFQSKRHQLAHLIHELEFHGNPNMYSCWIDESLNKSLKSACKNVSQFTFDATVLSGMNAIQRRTAQSFRRR